MCQLLSGCVKHSYANCNSDIIYIVKYSQNFPYTWYNRQFWPCRYRCIAIDKSNDTDWLLNYYNDENWVVPHALGPTSEIDEADINPEMKWIHMNGMKFCCRTVLLEPGTLLLFTALHYAAISFGKSIKWRIDIQCFWLCYLDNVAPKIIRLYVLRFITLLYIRT